MTKMILVISIVLVTLGLVGCDVVMYPITAAIVSHDDAQRRAAALQSCGRDCSFDATGNMTREFLVQSVTPFAPVRIGPDGVTYTVPNGFTIILKVGDETAEFMCNGGTITKSLGTYPIDGCPELRKQVGKSVTLVELSGGSIQAGLEYQYTTGGWASYELLEFVSLTPLNPIALPVLNSYKPSPSKPALPEQKEAPTISAADMGRNPSTGQTIVWDKSQKLWVDLVTRHPYVAPPAKVTPDSNSSDLPPFGAIPVGASRRM